MSLAWTVSDVAQAAFCDALSGRVVPSTVSRVQPAQATPFLAGTGGGEG
jgi:hypothetical protein